MISSTLEKELTIFREMYAATRCTAYQDFIVYRCAFGKANDAAKQANGLISEMGLSLVAIPNAFPYNNSYTIQSNETEL